MRISRTSNKIPSHNFYEMEMIGDRYFTVAVPIDAEDDLKMKVMGAIKTHLMGQKSVDYVIKLYGPHWTFSAPDKEVLFIVETLRAVDNIIEGIIDKIANEKSKSDHVGIFAAITALIRLKPTFSSIHLLIIQGYSFEAAALCRLILEQYGFAYTVHKMNDVEKILKIKPSKTIRSLKTILPYAGKLYGELSSRTHLEPKDNRFYIEKRDDSIFVRYNLPEDAKMILYYYLNLSSDFITVANEISGLDNSAEEVIESRISVQVEILNEALNKLNEELF